MERFQTVNFDSHKIFVFVRQDLPIEQQLVQSIHATYHASVEFGGMWLENFAPEGVPFVVLVGVPDAKALARVKTKLDTNKLRFNEFLDTDIDTQPSAIATFPLPPEQAVLLASYRLWRYSPRTVLGDAGLNAERGANAAVAQTLCS